MVAPDTIVAKVTASLGESTQVELEDLTGTMDHYSMVVISEAFEGERRLKRKRMVFGALSEEMKGPIHALTVLAYTPSEWAEEQN